MTDIPRPAAGRTRDGFAAVAGVALFSERPAELARFYEHVLRAPFTHRVHADGREHWILALGGVQFEVKALVAADGTATADSHESGGSTGLGRAELSFRVDDVAGTRARALEHGARELQPTERFAWGTFAVVADPDGNRLGLFARPDRHTSPDLEAQA